VTGFIGYCGQLGPETRAVLVDLQLEFPPLAEPQLERTRVPKHRDIQSRCVFTVDPESSVDLDDALSLEVQVGGYLLGVHIAGVTMFHGMVSWADMVARTSTLYFPHRADHLLPKPVVALATLDTSGPKYALSVFLPLDEQGQLRDDLAPAVERTLIQSCCRLSYDAARDVITGRVTHGAQLPPAHRPARPAMEQPLFSSLKELNRLMQARFRRKLEAGYVVNSRQEMRFEVD
jgi:DIS3-like exonuclease 2